jgi:demethylmenaquinone methyltransferase/2-methoxy-6-polyprenyl-1,4-benzoquinol methylase
MSDLDKSSAAISGMFSRIAGRYDFLNHVLSFNADRSWRRRAAEEVNGNPGPLLDLATGTGDLAFELSHKGTTVFGADFCLDMLAIARRKASDFGRVGLAAADALALPFADATFSVVTVAFGVRNFSDLRRGLLEIRRVLKPGGRAVVLEFSKPRGLWGALYRFHASWLLPKIGGWISGQAEAYRYLNRSSAEWPDPASFSAILAQAGFKEIRARSFHGGIVALHRATRP